MSPIINGSAVFNEIPTQGHIIPGQTIIYDTSKTLDLENITLKDGSILIKMLYFALDVHMRSRMRDAAVPGYIPAFTIGKPIVGHGLGVVIESKNSRFVEGSHVTGFLDFSEYCVVEEGYLLDGLVLLKNELELPWSLYLGILGISGRTAVFGWKEHARAKNGGVAFVSTGAGAVGSMVVQLAKRDGMKVIASAGTDAKVDFMKRLGADVAFNYKTTPTDEVLANNGPIDLCWDNVGGESLDTALAHAANSATFIACGVASEEPYAFKNMSNIIARQVQINGFNTRALYPKHEGEFSRTIPQLVASGELKYREDITVGLDKADIGLLNLFTGANTGKSLVRVSQDVDE
ncbi:NAD(P)-binding protein [Mycena floridula]|nr:NAD(P)-binding protein [Mycena floridula]